MKSSIKTVISLTVICAVVALLLAVTNYITAPIISDNEKKATEKALSEVLPSGENFKPLDISSYDFPKTVTEIYTEDNGGFVVKLNASGYSSGLIIMCGIDENGKVVNTKCIASNETLGYEYTYGESLKEKSILDIGGVDTVAGATKTTKAYKNAVSDALSAVDYFGKDGAAK